MDRACGTYWDRRVAYVVLMGGLRERNHLEDIGVDVKIILKYTLKKWNGAAWTGLI
jgi:hypothetical protein